MLSPVQLWLTTLDRQLAALAAALLLPLAAYILLSGLDDLVLDLVWLRRLLRPARPLPPPPQRESRIAIFLPCWHEAAVIGKMLEHNLSVIRHRNFDFFVGVYPNDPETLNAVRPLEERFTSVHVALTPHDGPTSKPDCLNWIYQRMLLFEEERGVRFDLVLVHDAEDLIHAGSLHLAERLAQRAGMIQLPVLAMPTPWRDFTHGVYCDDFAESQTKDLLSRVELGGFLPGCGVGTAIRRDALERLAAARMNRIFEPACLTEDYELGYLLHRLGCRQEMAPVLLQAGMPVATREYFPRTRRQAVRQRARWITGNSLQAWERHGWGGRLADAWFFWRDRKGLWGNPLSLLCNLLLAYGSLSWLYADWAGGSWPVGELLRANPLRPALLWATAALLAERTAVRMAVAGRIYGLGFALLAPLRMFWANYVNTLATLRSLRTYVTARWHGVPLVWVKTEHCYPSRGTLLSHKRKLGEVLVGSGYLTVEQLDAALASKPLGLPLGEHLLAIAALSQEELYEALSLQQGLPLARVAPADVPHRIARTLPSAVAQKLRVMPFKVTEGGLCVATPDIPTDEVQQVVQRYTRLEVRFHLVTPGNFEDLRRERL